jgi:hypothetical protein
MEAPMAADISVKSQEIAAGGRMGRNRYGKSSYVIVFCPMRECFFLAVSIERYRSEA